MTEPRTTIPLWERLTIAFCIFVAAAAIGATVAMSKDWYQGPWYSGPWLIGSAYAGNYGENVGIGSQTSNGGGGGGSINLNSCCPAGMRFPAGTAVNWRGIGDWFRGLTRNGWYSGSWYTGGWYHYSVSSYTAGNGGMDPNSRGSGVTAW